MIRILQTLIGQGKRGRPWNYNIRSLFQLDGGLVWVGKIWLVKTGEPVPLTGNERLLRMGLLAEILQQRGHDVTWWTSTFSHSQRSHMADVRAVIRQSDNYRIVMLHSPGYRRSISLSRVWDHAVLAYRFRRAIQSEDPPSLILSAFPTIELAAYCSDYGRQHGVPVVIDLRDMWPDIFVERMPVGLQQTGKTILRNTFSMTRRALRNATALTGITPGFLEWGLGYAGRDRTDLDRVFPLAYPRPALTKAEVDRALRFWHSLGISDGSGQMVVCYFGTLGHQLDMETVIGAAMRMRSMPIKFVICGSGDNMNVYREMAIDLDNVLFPGWMGATEIWTLMQLSSIGLAPYRSSTSFTVSIPNKAVEYLAGGLPIVTSLDGVLRQLIEETGCGCWYENGDVESLVSILTELWLEQRRLELMAQRAFRLYTDRFQAEKVYPDFADHLEKIALGGARGPAV
jgi:glycosyltransferase involved in cell wall biosynthesis